MKAVVVGGGIAGLVSAYALARAGIKVEVLEKAKIGSGCSGKAFGILIAFHDGVQGGMAKVQRVSVAQWPELAQQVADDTETTMDMFFRIWETGYQVRLPEVFDVIRQAIVARNGVIREGVDVTDIEPLRQEFDAVILAAGLGNAQLAGLPVSELPGQAVRVRPSSGPLQEMIHEDGLFMIPDWDGTVMIGGEPATGKWPDDAVTAKLRDKAMVRKPALGELEVVDSWVGERPTSKPLLPLVRPVAESVWGITGLGRLGFCLAPAVGELVKLTVQGQNA